MQPILGTTYTGHIVGVIEVSCINGVTHASLVATVAVAAFLAVHEDVFSTALEDVCADAFTNSSADESESG